MKFAKTNQIFVAIVGVLSLLLMVAVLSSSCENQKANGESSTAKTVKSSKSSAKKTSSKIVKKETVDWHHPSEKKPYPTVERPDQVVLKVETTTQRVHIVQNGQVIYTMKASTGMDDSTPKGVFQMESDRGDSFYNPDEKMGANYWSSFKDHGVYMFHSVPTDINGNYIKSEAELLGEKPASHGCVRLSIADAKWIKENIPTGTMVEIL